MTEGSRNPLCIRQREDTARVCEEGYLFLNTPYWTFSLN
jgi:hypothetical protein